MPVITGIVAIPAHAHRFELDVDGKRFATVSLDIIDRLRLRVGAELDAAAIAAVEQEAQVLRAYDRALNMLAFRARSAAELRRQLLRKGEPEPSVAAALERLLGAGLVDDREYARQYARSKVVGSGFSRRRVAQELRKRGVGREVAEHAIAEAFQDDQVEEDAVIERAARKKLRTLVSVDPAVRRRRLYSFLARRGFESDDIRSVLSRVLGESVEEGDAGRGGWGE